MAQTKNNKVAVQAGNEAVCRAHRREALMARAARQDLQGVLVISRDNTRYLTGFSGTESMALIVPGTSVILVDCRYIEQAGRQCTDMQAELVQVMYDSLKEQAGRLGIRRLGIEDAVMTVAEHRAISELLPDVTLVGVSAELSDLRVIKDESETVLIREAVRIADDAWAELLPQIKVGMTEKEVAGRLEFLMRMKGATGPSFDLIIASGWRSAMPHGVASDKRIEAGDTLVMDFGCVYEGYCSDITRTVFVQSVPEEIGRIYDIVLEAQLKAEAEIKAGMKGSDCDAIARAVIDSAGYGAFFGHSLGHSLGLLIHESPNFSPRCRDEIPAGAVLSVEPGIYLPGKGGVRIEDIGRVCTDHYERYTNAAKEKIIIPG